MDGRIEIGNSVCAQLFEHRHEIADHHHAQFASGLESGAPLDEQFFDEGSSDPCGYIAKDPIEALLLYVMVTETSVG